MAPTDAAYWSLPELDFVGDSVATPSMPLGLCQGKLGMGGDGMCYRLGLSSPPLIEFVVFTVVGDCDLDEDVRRPCRCCVFVVLSI